MIPARRPITAWIRTEDAVADIAVFDDHLRVVAHAPRAPWRELRVILAPGLYLVRTRVGTGCHEQYLEVGHELRVLNGPQGDPRAIEGPHEREPEACVLRVPPVAFLSAAPLAGTLPHHPEHADLVLAHSRTVHAAPGTGGLLHVVAREAAAPSPGTTADARGPDPASGRPGPLTGVWLNDMAGRPLVNLGEHGIHEPAHGLQSCHVAVTPGHYRLSWPARSRNGRELTLEQALFVPRGWRLHVFLMWLPGDALPRISIHMTPRDRSFEANCRHARASELLQQALSAERGHARTTDRTADGDPAPAEILRLLDDPACDPIAAVCAGWLLLRQGRLARDMHRGLIARLRGIVDAHHPDVETLALAIADPDDAPLVKRAMARPPMLDASWDHLVQRSVQWPELVPGMSLAGEIATGLYPVPLWLTWAVRGLAGEAHPDLLTAALERLVVAAQSRTPSAREPIRIGDLIAALGVPHGVVVQGLARLGERATVPAVREVARALAEPWAEKPAVRVAGPRPERMSTEWQRRQQAAASEIRALIEQGRRLDAVERLDQWERHARADQATDDDIARGYNQLSTQWRRAELFDLAVAAAERALELTPHHPASYTTLAEAFMTQGKLDAAEAVYLDALSQFASNAYIQVGLARAFKAQGKLDQAEVQYRATIARFPDNEFAHAGLGDVLKAQNKLDQAEAQYRATIVRFPDNEFVRTGLADVLRVQGKLELAEAEYRDTIARFPRDAFARTGLGDVLRAQGKLDQAEAQYRDTIARFPDNEFARNGLGEVLKAQGKLDQAEAQYRDTIARFPDNDFARNGLAGVLRAQGKLDQAEAQYRDTIAQFPDDPVAATGLGEVLKAQNRFDDAEAQYRAVIARFPDNEFARNGLGEVLKTQGKLDQAEAQYRDNIARSPDNEFSRNGLAGVLKAQGKLDQAEAQYRDTVARFPDDPVAPTGLGDALKAQGKLDQAEVQYRHTAARFPDNEFARNGLAEVLKAQGKLDQAEAQYRDTVARFPADPVAPTGLGEVLKAQGKLDQAEAQYRDTVARFPGDSVARNGLAEVLKAQGKLDQAEAQYRDTIARFPSEPVARNGLGEVLKAQGKLDQAEAQYRDTIARFPADVVARAGLGGILKAQGKLDQAEAQYRDTIVRFPMDVVARTGLGDILKTQGRLDQAEIQYRDTIARFPNNEVARNGLGEVLKAQGKLDQAEIQYRETMARFPADNVTRTGLGGVLKAQGKLDQADAQYRDTIARFPMDVVARTGLGEVLKAQGKLDQAEAQYRDTVARFPGNEVARNGLANLLRRQQRWLEALQLVPEPAAWRTLDDHIKGHTRALILIAMGDHAAGVALLERGLAEGWQIERAYFLSALAVARLRNRESVDQTLRELEQEPSSDRTAVVPILRLHHHANTQAWPQALTDFRELSRANLQHQERAAVKAIDEGFGLSARRFHLPDPAVIHHISEQLIEIVQMAA